MPDPGYQRRLAAILAADVVGYSRLMGAAEEETLSTLKARRIAFARLVEAHRGRVVNAPGDAILAEFSSVADALTTALEAQREFAAINSELPAKRRMQFRIGVNLGDVIKEDGAIYGDAVNVAARLEALAPAGGICVSARVRDSVLNHPEFRFSDMGLRTVKNIGYSLRAYQLSDPGREPGRVTRWIRNARHGTSRRLRLLVAAMAGVVTVALAAGGAWYGQRAALPRALENPRPSLAVLPFQCFCADAPLRDLANGYSEDLTTDLSQVRDLRVIARNIAFAWRDKPVDLREAGTALGARYILEGSLRPNGTEVVINAQLIDASEGTHLWAGRYPIPYPIRSAALDETRLKIVTELEVALVEGEQARRWRMGSTVAEAYAAYQQGERFFFAVSGQSIARAREMYRHAVALDPAFAQALAKLAATHVLDVKLCGSRDAAASLDAARAWAERALKIDPQQTQALVVLSQVELLQRGFDAAIGHALRAREIAPTDSNPAIALGLALLYAGRVREAQAAIQDAIKLWPTPPPFVHSVAGRVAYLNGRPEEALRAFRRNIELNPEDFRPYMLAAIVLEEQGRPDEAIGMLRKVYELAPGFVPDACLAWSEPYLDAEITARVLGHLLQARNRLMMQPGDFVPWPRARPAPDADRIAG